MNTSKKKRKLNKNEQARIAREIGKHVQIRNRMQGLYKCKKIGYVRKTGGAPSERISQYMYCGTYPPEKGD